MDTMANVWALGRECRRCAKLCAVLPDARNGVGRVSTPITGQFAFACSHCGADNSLHTDELVRFRVQAPSFEHAA